MIRLLLSLLLAAAVPGLGLTLPGPARAEAGATFITGGRVGIVPPRGMIRDPAAPRFRDAGRDASIAVLDLPDPAYEEIERGLFAAADDPGVTVLGREAFPFRGGIGYLVQIRLEAEGAAHRKWFLLGRSADRSGPVALVTADIPEAAREAYPDAAIRAALASTTFRPAPVEEQLGLFPFNLSDRAGFRVVQAHPAIGVQLTEGPRDHSPDQPVMLISIIRQKSPPPADRANAARQMLQNFGLPNLRITDVQVIRAKGVTTFEVRGESKDERSASAAVQWVRFGDSGVLRLVGVVPSERWEEFFPRFRAVRDGLEPR